MYQGSLILDLIRTRNQTLTHPSIARASVSALQDGWMKCSMSAFGAIADAGSCPLSTVLWPVADQTQLANALQVGCDLEDAQRLQIHHLPS